MNHPLFGGNPSSVPIHPLRSSIRRKAETKMEWVMGDGVEGCSPGSAVDLRLGRLHVRRRLAHLIGRIHRTRFHAVRSNSTADWINGGPPPPTKAEHDAHYGIWLSLWPIGRLTRRSSRPTLFA